MPEATTQYTDNRPELDNIFQDLMNDDKSPGIGLLKSKNPHDFFPNIDDPVMDLSLIHI